MLDLLSTRSKQWLNAFIFHRSTHTNAHSTGKLAMRAMAGRCVEVMSVATIL